jgi:hypothetical protein
MMQKVNAERTLRAPACATASTTAAHHRTQLVAVADPRRAPPSPFIKRPPTSTRNLAHRMELQPRIKWRARWWRTLLGADPQPTALGQACRSRAWSAASTATSGGDPSASSRRCRATARLDDAQAPPRKARYQGTGPTTCRYQLADQHRPTKPHRQTPRSVRAVQLAQPPRPPSEAAGRAELEPLRHAGDEVNSRADRLGCDKTVAATSSLRTTG